MLPAVYRLHPLTLQRLGASGISGINGTLRHPEQGTGNGAVFLLLVFL